MYKQAGNSLLKNDNMKNLKLISLISIPLAPIMELVEKYVFGDWEFAKFLIVLVVIDTMLGFVKHYMLHDISSKAYGMIAKKLIVYSVVMIVGHVLASFAVNGQSVESFVWFRYFSCSALLVREGISILENSNTIYPGLIPKAIIRRLADFDSDTGKPISKKGGDDDRSS